MPDFASAGGACGAWRAILATRLPGAIPRMLSAARSVGLPGVLLGMLLGVLTACGGNARAPVEDRGGGPRPKAPVQSVQSPTSYRVQAGDTLYSIAFRYGMDFRKVAAANNIPAPYTIFTGQTLWLREAPLPAVAPAAPAPKPQPQVAPPAAPVPVPVPEAQPRPSPAPTGKTFVGQKVGSWRWPTEGRVIRGYSGSVHKGIDIDGQRGDPVHAVAAGVVVYAGTGIVGFGQLLIVKHNDIYLSAYGHNDRLLVAEGQVVAAGQQIAEKGSSGTDIVKLHFEVRKEGKPIDPQRLLPRR